MICRKTLCNSALLVLFLIGTGAEKDTSFLDKFIVPYRWFQQTRFDLAARRLLTNRNFRSLQHNKKLQPVVPPRAHFPCSTARARSSQAPKSVHQLRPGDIDIIAAMGDSLTAGVGLLATGSDIQAIPFENRGASFSIGGQNTWRESLTLPNILKEFNPNLFGYSLGPSLSTHRASQFNVAESGAVSKNMPYMAKVLVKRIRSDPRVDVKNHWKLITIMIGDNDFCSEFCYNDINSILKEHESDIITALRILKKNLPRTFVNIIPPPSIKPLTEMNDRPPICEYITHSFECPCILGLAYRNVQKRYLSLIEKWQQLDVAISFYPEFNTEDFAVVAQPFMTNFSYPRTADGRHDYSYSSSDCFHFSLKGNAGVANALWNAMLEPVGRKSTSVNDQIFNKFNCPTPEHPYIFTSRNSYY